jgi:GNAT superfamily N-acetyltransferase
VVLWREFNLPEGAVRFLIRSRGEVQHIRRSCGAIVAEPDAPQPVDDERLPILPQFSLMVEHSVAIEAIGVDFAITKVADEKTSAKPAEGRRRHRQAGFVGHKNGDPIVVDVSRAKHSHEHDRCAQPRYEESINTHGASLSIDILECDPIIVTHPDARADFFTRKIRADEASPQARPSAADTIAAMTTDERLRIIPATANDTAVILRMIKGLAEYEKLSDRVTATETSLREQLFGATPAAEVCLAFVGEQPVGFAVFHGTFSTFACRPGIYLEDVYVEPQWRSRGVGHRLLAHVASIGAARGCQSMNWAVLPWNEPAIRFYRRLGAEKVTEWDGFRIDGEAFGRLARLRITT